MTQPHRRVPSAGWRRTCSDLGRFAAVALVTATMLVGGQLVGPVAHAAAAPAAACTLPAPDPNVVFNEHEGETDYHRWLEPTGVLRAAVLFVDFDDAQGTPEELSARRQLLQPAADWLRSSSYGKATLDLRWTTSWRRIRRSQHDFAGYNRDFFIHQAYLQAGVTASDAAFDFSQVQLVYLVAPKSASVITNSPAFIASPGFGVHADGVELRHGATLGQDMDTWGFRVVNHETGHTFGLPDQYIFGLPWPQLHEASGGWDLMGDILGPAPDHLAWHKRKLGWLTDAQLHCQTTAGRVSRTLSPLGAVGGTKAIVVRTGERRAVVVENRQAGELDGGSCFRAGVLAYVVDASVGGGNRPIRVLDGHPATSVPNCGPDQAPLADATLQVGEHLVEPESGVRVRVTSGRGLNRTVQVTVPAATAA